MTNDITRKPMARRTFIQGAAGVVAAATVIGKPHLALSAEPPIGGAYTQPNKSSAALITIDMQNDFSLPGAPSEIAGTYDVIPAMVRVQKAFREAGKPIIHVVRLYKPDGSNVDIARRALLEGGAKIVNPGTEGAELVDQLKPGKVRFDADALLAGQLQKMGENEWGMFKPRWGAFYGTDLDGHLKSMGVDTLVIIGCNFPNCPRTTIYQASERDYRLIVVPDAISGVYDKGRQEIRNIGAQLLTAAETADWIAG